MTNISAVLDKIAKLRVLAARATTQGEAEAAAAQAELLIAKYQIEEAQIESVSTERVEAIGESEPLWSAQRDQRWIGVLAGGLSKDHGCGCVCAGADGVAYRVAGRPSDVAIVRYMFAWLTVEIARLSERESGRAAKNAFRLGAVVGVLAAMRRSKATITASAPAGAAMVLVSRADDALTHLKSVIGGKFSKRSAPRSADDSGAFSRGKVAGEGLTAKPAMGGGGGLYLSAGRS